MLGTGLGLMHASCAQNALIRWLLQPKERERQDNVGRDKTEQGRFVSWGVGLSRQRSSMCQRPRDWTGRFGIDQSDQEAVFMLVLYGRLGPVLAYLDAVGSYPPYVCILLVQVIMYV